MKKYVLRPLIEMKGLRKILRVLWTAKKTNEWVLNKTGVKRELLNTVKARKLAYYGHTMRKQGNCLEKEIMQGTMPGARRRGRPRTAWIDNIKSRTGSLSKSQSEWQRTEINGESTSMVRPTLGSRTAKEQNRTEHAAYFCDIKSFKKLNLQTSVSNMWTPVGHWTSWQWHKLGSLSVNWPQISEKMEI